MKYSDCITTFMIKVTVYFLKSGLEDESDALARNHTDKRKLEISKSPHSYLQKLCEFDFYEMQMFCHHRKITTTIDINFSGQICLYTMERPNVIFF